MSNESEMPQAQIPKKDEVQPQQLWRPTEYAVNLPLKHKKSLQTLQAYLSARKKRFISSRDTELSQHPKR